MEIGTKVQFVKPIWQGMLVISKGREGILVKRPFWYSGIAEWDYYVELEPYVVAGVRSNEIEVVA